MTIKKLQNANNISNEIKELAVQIKECKEAIKSFKDGFCMVPLFHEVIEFVPVAQFGNFAVKDKEFAILCLELYLERLQKRRELLIAEFRNL